MFRFKFVRLFLICALGQLLYGQAAFDFQTTAYFTSSSFCDDPNWGSTTAAVGYYDVVNVNTCIPTTSGVSYKVSCSANGLTYTLDRYNTQDCSGSVGKSYSNKAVNTCIDPWDNFNSGVVFFKVNCYESDPYAVNQANADDDDVVAAGEYFLTIFSTPDCSDVASPVTVNNGDCTTYNAAYSSTPPANSAWKAFKGYVSTNGTVMSFKIYGDTACKSDSFIIEGAPGACIQAGNAGYKIAATPAIEKVDRAVCFAGTETVLLESGAVVQMEDVQLGDRIQVASVSDESLSFAEVISLPHGKNSQSASFIEIEATNGATIKVTPYHLVMSGSCGANDMELNLAQNIVVGDCMDTIDGPVMVTSATEAHGRGIYTVVTSHLDGVIVVNGFKASSFAISHAIANSYYHIHRALHAYMPGFDGVRSTIASVASQIASIY